MRALVTGSTGFIGSHLCRALIEHGYEVRAFHRENSPLDLLADIPVEHVQGDITQPDTLMRACQGVQVIFHTAAHLGRRDARLAYETTVLGTRNVLNAALAAGVERVVHTSSVAALGLPFHQRINGKFIPLPIDEQHNWNYTQTGWPYGFYKHTAEQEVQFAIVKGLDAVIVNPSLVVGAADLNQIAGAVIIRLAKSHLPFAIEGGLSLIHIRDAIKGHLAALDVGKTGERYILSSECWTHQQFLANIFQSAGGRTPKFVIPANAIRIISRPMRPFLRLFNLPVRGEFFDRVGFYFYFENKKARSELKLSGFVPVRQGIQEAMEWYQARGVLNV